MKKYIVTQAAKRDLMAIAQYGDENYGNEKSDQYRDKLEQKFVSMAGQPYLYPAVDHIHDGYRRSVCGVHSIYYKIEGQGIAIIRILNRQNPDKAF